MLIKYCYIFTINISKVTAYTKAWEVGMAVFVNVSKNIRGWILPLGKVCCLAIDCSDLSCWFRNVMGFYINSSPIKNFPSKRRKPKACLLVAIRIQIRADIDSSVASVLEINISIAVYASYLKVFIRKLHNQRVAAIENICFAAIILKKSGCSTNVNIASKQVPSFGGCS